MWKFKFKTLFFSLFGLSVVVSCNSTKIVLVELDNECIPVIESFFNKIKSGNYEVALDDLLKSNNDINLNDSGAIDLKEKFRQINEYSGRYLEYKILKKRGIEDDIAIYSCLVKYQKRYYRYVFIFYKADTKAVIHKFLLDDGIDVELEESLKFYYK